MAVTSAWQAMTGSPLRFLLSAWPWRVVLYLLSGGVLGVGLALALTVVMLFGVGLSITPLGVVLLAGAVLSGLVISPVELRRLTLVDTAPVVPYRLRVPPRAGLWAWLTTRLRDPATWRGFALSLVTATLGVLDLIVVGCALLLPGTLLAIPVIMYVHRDDVADADTVFLADSMTEALMLVPVGVALFLLSLFGLTTYAAGRAAVARAVLSAPEADMEPVVALTRSRARLVDAFEAERRRIERDLHDGAQQRLVEVSMTLGLARLDLPEGSPAAVHVARAHEQARQALADLRELVRGIHPQVLTDRGLGPAIEDVAGRTVVPVAVDVELSERPSSGVEAAAYFVVTEALTNVARHSQARQAAVRVWRSGRMLMVEVTDDGVGGADSEEGSGLTGLADRVAALNGRVILYSPPGGPTRLRAEIPCR